MENSLPNLCCHLQLSKYNTSIFSYHAKYNLKIIGNKMLMLYLPSSYTGVSVLYLSLNCICSVYVYYVSMYVYIYIYVHSCVHVNVYISRSSSFLIITQLKYMQTVANSKANATLAAVHISSNIENCSTICKLINSRIQLGFLYHKLLCK